LSQNFGPLDWRPGPVKVSQKTQNTPLSEPVPGEPLTQIKKIFLIEPRRLAAAVEGLNNSLAIAAKINSGKNSCSGKNHYERSSGFTHQLL